MQGGWGTDGALAASATAAHCAVAGARWLMAEGQLPPAPWRWIAVATDVEPGPHEALVSEVTGERIAWAAGRSGGSVVAAAARDLLARAPDLDARVRVLEAVMARLPEVVGLFREFEATALPVAQADVLLQLSNTLAALEWDLAGEPVPSWSDHGDELRDQLEEARRWARRLWVALVEADREGAGSFDDVPGWMVDDL